MTRTTQNSRTRTTYKLSKEGLQEVERSRKLKGWGRTSREWTEASMSSESTLKRFLRGEAISPEHFKTLCSAVGIEQWQVLVDWQGEDIDSMRVGSEKEESEPKNVGNDNFISDESSQSKYGLAVTGVFSADKKLEIETALKAVKNLLLTCQIVIEQQKND
jgi:hypothetical protein